MNTLIVEGIVCIAPSGLDPGPNSVTGSTVVIAQGFIRSDRWTKPLDRLNVASLCRQRGAVPLIAITSFGNIATIDERDLFVASVSNRAGADAAWSDRFDERLRINHRPPSAQGTVYRESWRI